MDSPQRTRLRMSKLTAATLTVAAVSMGMIGGLAPAATAADTPPTGAVTGWGANVGGVLELPDSVSGGVVAIAAGEDHALALKNGGVIAWGDGGRASGDVPQDAKSGVTAIAAGDNGTSLAVKNGSVIAWGDDSYGVLAVPSTATTDVVAVDLGFRFALALKSDGSVIAWGANAAATPIGATSGIIAISTNGGHSLALRNDGTVIGWGGTPGSQVPATARSGVVAIAAGYYQSLALKADGSVIAWGFGFNGEQVAPAEVSSGVVAIAAGGYGSIASKGDGSVIAWGTAAAAPLASGKVLAIATEGNYSLRLSATASPVVSVQPVSVSVVEGSSATFTAAASGEPAPSVRWQRAAAGSSVFTDIPGAVTGTYSTGALAVGESGSRYRAAFTNSAGTTVSDAATTGVSAASSTITATKAALGRPYAFTIPVSGTPAVAVTSGRVPVGVTVDGSGLITGTPSVAGYYQFTVSTGGSPAQVRVTLEVQPGTTVSGTAVDGVVDSSYSWGPTVTGAGAVVSVTDGELPGGVTLRNNRLGGSPTKAGTFTFTLSADNGFGSPATLVTTVTVREAPSIEAAAAPWGTVGIGYSFSFGLGGSPAPTVKVTAGSLPPGLVLAADGTVTGTPSAAGTYVFTITADNGAATTAKRQASIAISGAPVITGAPPVATTGVAYSFGFTAGGSPAPTVSLKIGTLPSGLTLSSAGVLSGTPTQAGVFTFTVGATNASGTAVRQVTLTIGDAPAFTLDAPAGTFGTAYSYTVSATGTVTGTGLPPGLSISAAGVVAGTPTAAGSWSVAVTATNAYGSVTKTQLVNIAPATTGGIAIVAAPASVQPGASESAEIQVFAEKTNHTLTSALTLGGTTIPAGTKINSYYVHADAIGAANVAHAFTGKLAFGTQILGVATTVAELQSTTALLGNTSVTYSTNVDQGLEYNDVVTTAAAEGNITLSFQVYDTSDAIRIITIAP